MQTAIPELLRYDSPGQSLGRVALEDLEISSRKIKTGQGVNLLIGAANRDPEQFPDPDRLDITRKGNRHLSFGFGPHFCVGAALAEMEGQIAIETVLRHMPEIRLDTPDLEWSDNPNFRGLKSLPMKF